MAAVFLGAVDLSVIATVLPEMIADLGINTADIDRFIWVVTGYLIAYVAAIPFAGMMGDAIGRRTTLIVALVAFFIGSIVCAMANDLSQLVAGRVIQGFGGGAILPITIALAGQLDDQRVRVRTIGRVAAIDMFGWLIGPTYGALVAQLPSTIDDPWRWIFWLNLPLTVALAIPMVRDRGDPHHPDIRNRADWIGAGLLAAAITLFSLGITSSGEAGTVTSGLRAFGGTPNPLAELLPYLLALGGVLTLLFVWRQRAASSPMVPLWLIRRPGGLATLIANFAIGTVMMVAIVNVPVVVALTETGGRGSALTAVLLGVFTGSIVVSSVIADRLLARFRPPIVAGTSAAAVVSGMALAYPLLADHDPPRLIPALVLAGLGIGTLLPPLTNAGVSQVDRAMTGVSVSLVLLARLTGMTIGVSALTAVGVRRLQTLTGQLDPIVQAPGEQTASYLARQQAFVIDVAIPLAVKVVQETFLIGAIIAALAIFPLLRLPESGRPEGRD